MYPTALCLLCTRAQIDVVFNIYTNTFVRTQGAMQKMHAINLTESECSYRKESTVQACTNFGK